MATLQKKLVFGQGGGGRQQQRKMQRRVVAGLGQRKPYGTFSGGEKYFQSDRSKSNDQVVRACQEHLQIVTIAIITIITIITITTITNIITITISIIMTTLCVFTCP